MWGYIIRRIVSVIPTLLIVSVIVFSLIRLIPGDPVMVMLGGAQVDQAVIDEMRQKLGLDHPIYIQFFDWISNAIQGDLGESVTYHQSVLPLIGTKLNATLLLAVASIVGALVISIPLGIVSAVRRESKIGYLAVLFSQIGVATPGFFLAIVLILVFSLYARVLPSFGYADLVIDPAAAIRYLTLPAVTLAMGYAALLTGVTRSSMLEVLDQDYVRTARSKGLAERIVVYKHAFRNALIPIMTIAGLNIGYLLGGTVIIEQVFSWPGMGRLMINAIFDRDYPLVQGCIMIFAVIFVFVNLIVDLLYTVVDPRIRY